MAAKRKRPHGRNEKGRRKRQKEKGEKSPKIARGEKNSNHTHAHNTNAATAPHGARWRSGKGAAATTPARFSTAQRRLHAKPRQLPAALGAISDRPPPSRTSRLQAAASRFRGGSRDAVAQAARERPNCRARRRQSLDARRRASQRGCGAHRGPRNDVVLLSPRVPRRFQPADACFCRVPRAAARGAPHRPARARGRARARALALTPAQGVGPPDAPTCAQRSSHPATSHAGRPVDSAWWAFARRARRFSAAPSAKGRELPARLPPPAAPPSPVFLVGAMGLHLSKSKKCVARGRGAGTGRRAPQPPQRAGPANRPGRATRWVAKCGEDAEKGKRMQPGEGVWWRISASWEGGWYARDPCSSQRRQG